MNFPIVLQFVLQLEFVYRIVRQFSATIRAGHPRKRLAEVVDLFFCVRKVSA